ncbi:2-hydroxyacid dehydrogenase-like 1 [Symbiodinium microadriaticum]|uniref:2-hydroxyacid dehydrogenase-like 1 n=1 Tax=Symbiodinium microadriaticum TaxID=2951 RepID=A0A1Q9DZP2_SYMMI|nr:2-hydroxyacid dehydrogenase-like 1 [Symbiodinium microadriaticum]
MAQAIIAQCAKVDKAGTGTVKHDSLAKALKAALPDAWHDDEIESLLHPWGAAVEYKDPRWEDFVGWLFRDRSPVPRPVWDLRLGFRDEQAVAKIMAAMSSLCHVGCGDLLCLYPLFALDCTFVNDFAGEDVVKALAEEGVKLIALRCAGFDRVDLQAAKEAGVAVARVPAYSLRDQFSQQPSVWSQGYENRRIPNSYRNSRLGNFKLEPRVRSPRKKASDSQCKRIGTIAATVLKKGFECDVVAYDVFPNPKISDPAPDGLGIPYLDLDTAPLLPSTKHMINAEKLKIMKKGIMIVNTSRGGLIDTAALIQGLKDGTIAGAAMDVVEGEAPYFFRDFSTSCVTDDNIATLVRMPNVAWKTISDTTLKSMQGVREGTGPPKQNGVLVCLPPEAPKDNAKGELLIKAVWKELPAPGPELKEKDLPALENAHVAFYSAMPHDKEVFEKMSEEIFLEFDANITFQFFKAALCPETVEQAKGADAVGGKASQASEELSKLLTTFDQYEFGVKMVALRCGGFNNVDVETADELGLTIARVPAYSAFGSGEHAVALATSVNRSIPQAAEGTRRSNFALNGLLGFDMVGKKVGIIGTGRTGCVAARIFKNGYRCDVIAHDIEENELVCDAPPAGLGIPYVRLGMGLKRSLDELLRTSDIICLHVPLLRETAKLINADAIAKMKRGVILVNVSRGGLIDTRALIDGLRQGIVGGAGLDVVAEEGEYFHRDWSNKMQSDDLMTLIGFNNVVVTSHQAWFTKEALRSIIHTTLCNLNAARNGVRPPWQRGKYDTLVHRSACTGPETERGEDCTVPFATEEAALKASAAEAAFSYLKDGDGDQDEDQIAVMMVVVVMSTALMITTTTMMMMLMKVVVTRILIRDDGFQKMARGAGWRVGWMDGRMDGWMDGVPDDVPDDVDDDHDGVDADAAAAAAAAADDDDDDDDANGDDDDDDDEENGDGSHDDGSNGCVETDARQLRNSRKVVPDTAVLGYPREREWQTTPVVTLRPASSVNVAPLSSDKFYGAGPLEEGAPVLGPWVAFEDTSAHSDFAGMGMARPSGGFPCQSEAGKGSAWAGACKPPLLCFDKARLQLLAPPTVTAQDGPALPPIDLTALQTAVCRNTPEAQHMQACVAVKLRQVDTTNLVSVHRHVNRILLEAAATAFPKQPPADNRVSAQPAFRVTAKSVWHLYHTLKQPRVCAPREIFEKWKLAAAFARASKILRKQSHSLKKQFYESQVEQAEHAANHNDQRSLFLIIKRLSPKSHNIACRLRGSDGHLLTGPEQMQRIVAYGNETFAAKDDEHPRIPLATALRISSQDIAQELRKLGVSKAVPRHIAPAAVWKQCSQDLGCILSHAICHHMQPGNTGELDEDWKSSYVVWIPKPGKPQLDVTSLRPIGLSSPASKALAGSLRHHLLRGLAPALRMTPQFAYAKSRGTADALLRAHMHFEAVTKLVQDTQCTRFQKQAGGRARAVVGGLGLSLDLSKAFDGVTRAHIYSSMEQHGVPQDVITIIQQLHYRAQYVYQTGAQSGSTTTSNGIKQGCVIAPYLWNYFSLAYLSMLKERRSSAWIQQVLTLFADDVWGAWEIRSARDLDQAIADVSLILEALETLNMTINYSKTAILLKLVGKDARRLKQQHTFLKAGQPHLRVSVHGRDCGIPIKDQHEYLGTIVTYRHRHQRNMQHRLKACAVRYQGLRKLLNGSHHLAVHHRLRLWQACVCTSAFYAQHIVGVTTSTIATLTTTLTRHLRAIFRIPSHLTHITTREVWQQANLPMPGWALQHAQQQFIAKLEHRAEHAPDITTVSPIMQHIKREAARLEAMLMSEAEGLAKLPPQPPVVSCPYCQEAFVSENAMRVHCGLKHESVPKHSTRTPTVFCPELHSQAGMPACQLCKRQFWRWAHLVAHIESGACKCLGGDSEVRAPLPPDHAPAQIKQPPTVGLGLFEEENAANLMLGQDHDFAINEEAAIFANCWSETPEFLLGPSAPLTPDHRSQKRHRPNQPPHWPGRHPSHYHEPRGNPFGSSSYGPPRPPPQHDPLRLLTRVVLQQEQTISRLRHDKTFILFMRQGEDGTLGSLMRVAKEWNNKKSQENSAVRSPLRTVLLSSMIGALLKLAQQAVATEENKKKMVTAEWLTANSEWTYRVWNHAERRLVVDTNKSPLQHTEATRILTFLLEHLTGEAIQRFNSTVTLPKLEQQGANIATFALEVSLRGKAAAELYHSFERLCGNAIMNLIGVSMKKDTLPQTPAAKQLANLFYQRRQQPGDPPTAATADATARYRSLSISGALRDVNWVSLLTSQLNLVRAQLSALTRQVENLQPGHAELKDDLHTLGARLQSMEMEMRQNRVIKANLSQAPTPARINLHSLDD